MRRVVTNGRSTKRVSGRRNVVHRKTMATSCAETFSPRIQGGTLRINPQGSTLCFVINLSARPIPAARTSVEARSKPRQGIWRAESRASFFEEKRAAARSVITCVHSSPQYQKTDCGVFWTLPIKCARSTTSRVSGINEQMRIFLATGEKDLR